MVRKVLVAGARGMLGTDLCALLERRGWQVVAADIGEFDITDARATHAFVKDHLPSVIINCAAYTAVDQAESDPAIRTRASEFGNRLRREDGVEAAVDIIRAILR